MRELFLGLIVSVLVASTVAAIITGVTMHYSRATCADNGGTWTISHTLVETCHYGYAEGDLR